MIISPTNIQNENDNIQNEVQYIRWSDEYWQNWLAANITEYHIISKFWGPVSHLRESTISYLKSPSNSKSKKKNIQIGP